jgi:hypothetical protein
MAVIGFFNLLDGIAAIASSAFFVGGVRYVAGPAGLGLDHGHHRRRAAAGGRRGVGR